MRRYGSDQPFVELESWVLNDGIEHIRLTIARRGNG